jgi:RNA polymerase sigma factor (sigma-70 family)
LLRVADGRMSATQPRSGQAFTDLLAPLVEPGYRLACAMLHDPQAAEDAVQEASLIAWRKLGRLHDHSRLRAWYLGIVANECRNARRRRWATSVISELPAGLSVISSEERILTGTDLRRALRQLPHDDRLVVVLYFYLDMPLTEVAAVAGGTVGAVRARLYRAVRRLRPDLVIEESLE